VPRRGPDAGILRIKDNIHGSGVNRINSGLFLKCRKTQKNQNLPFVLRIIFVSPLIESACPSAIPNALNTASHWW